MNGETAKHLRSVFDKVKHQLNTPEFGAMVDAITSADAGGAVIPWDKAPEMLRCVSARLEVTAAKTRKAKRAHDDFWSGLLKKDRDQAVELGNLIADQYEAAGLGTVQRPKA